MTTKLETMAAVAAAHEAGHMIEMYDPYNKKWVFWQGASWHRSNEYRIAEPTLKPPVTVNLQCYLIDGQLHWLDSTRSVLREWQRVPSEDKTVEVMP